ncbi:hypothetical protein RvY_19488 [Ramazzottius varieornatus]|uniref:Uncharacterized protein n=1 Tax=Ramazzottius varieornatus TaxID=947166 RepID=A0A1D1WAB6_RAMVA|nr:hypothetical protein RvY_19373 [Ramazzottius varieornatus]GAV10003.1 hypothetical protein RvY_19488 [Ramazzottius varieornatus]
MGNALTSDAASDDFIPPPTMTINPTSSTPNRNMKKRELDDDTVMRLEDFIKQFNIGTSPRVVEYFIAQMKLRMVEHTWTCAGYLTTPNSSNVPLGDKCSSPTFRYWLRVCALGDDVWVISKGQWHTAIILIEADKYPEEQATDKYPGEQATSVLIYRIHDLGWEKRIKNKRTAQKDRATSPQTTEKKTRMPPSLTPVLFEEKEVAEEAPQLNLEVCSE